jgi:hypothetical protein
MIRQIVPVLFETFEAALTNSDPGSEERKMQVIYDGLNQFTASDFSRQVLAMSTERLRVASCGEVGWSDLGEPRRFIAALASNGDENPWAVTDICNKCGLTRDQIVTLSGQEKSSIPLQEPAMLTSPS